MHRPSSLQLGLAAMAATSHCLASRTVRDDVGCFTVADSARVNELCCRIKAVSSPATTARQ